MYIGWGGRGGDGGNKINEMLRSVKPGCRDKRGSSYYFLYFWVFESFNNKKLLDMN